MLICLSGRYIEQELALHYGNVPPAFMPIGAERLFNIQMRRFAARERCVITLPAEFEVGPADQQALDGMDVEILRTDPSLGLCAAIQQVLALVEDAAPVRILFGDTLVALEELPAGLTDYVAVKSTRIDYPWTYFEEIDGVPRFVTEDLSSLEKPRVVCGYFSFSDINLLRDAFAEPSLHDALNYYSARHRLTPVNAEQWHDFGHLALFYRSRRDVLVTRAFNSIEANDYTITKTSPHTQKMLAEAAWFEALPKKIMLHAPRYIGRTNKNFEAGYELEYLHLPTLSDMNVFGQLSPVSWEMILSCSLRLLAQLREIGTQPEVPEASPDYARRFFEEVIVNKTWSRFKSYCAEEGLTLDARFTLNGAKLPPLRQIIETTLASIPETQPSHISFWHGDFFFGNLFFDFNTQRTIMVDPRGMLFDNTISQYGDFRYDIGKLAHSVLGGYDHIIANRYSVARPLPTELEFDLPEFSGKNSQILSSRFCQMVEAEFGLKETTLYAFAAIMFFSMLPLHKESPERQAALLATGLGLASKLSI